MKIASHVLLVFAFAAFLSGCGDDQKSSKTLTVDTPQGKVTVKTEATADKDKIVVETADGKMTLAGDKDKYVVESSEGKAVVQTDGSGGTKITSTDKDGKEQTVEMSGKADSAAFEGMLYPGAKAEEGASFTQKVGDMSTSTTSFWSDDAPEKLVEHYKKLFPKAMSTTIESLTSIAGKKADGSDFSISIGKGEGNDKTRLTIMVIKQGQK